MEMQELVLNQESIRRCNNVSMFDAGNVIVREAQSTYKKFFDAFGTLSELTEDQQNYLDERAVKWKDLVESAYADELGRRADYVPVTVAGPSNYPGRQMEKRVDTLMKRRAEWDCKMQSFINNTQKRLNELEPIEKVLNEIRSGKWGHGETFASDDPYVIEKLTAKLDFLTKKQDRMKKVNAHYRKMGTFRGIEGISDEAAAHMDEQSCGQAPFPAYALTSGNTQIKSVKDRIEQLQKHKSEQKIQGFTFDGGTVEANYEADRLQIFFDEIPSKETREGLGSRGFHFSRRNGNAWQRQLTRNALSAARDVLKGLFNENG